MVNGWEGRAAASAASIACPGAGDNDGNDAAMGAGLLDGWEEGVTEVGTENGRAELLLGPDTPKPAWLPPNPAELRPGNPPEVGAGKVVPGAGTGVCLDRKSTRPGGSSKGQSVHADSCRGLCQEPPNAGASSHWESTWCFWGFYHVQKAS